MRNTPVRLSAVSVSAHPATHPFMSSTHKLSEGWLCEATSLFHPGQQSPPDTQCSHERQATQSLTATGQIALCFKGIPLTLISKEGPSSRTVVSSEVFIKSEEFTTVNFLCGTFSTACWRWECCCVMQRRYAQSRIDLCVKARARMAGQDCDTA